MSVLPDAREEPHSEEGFELWCGARNASDPQAHEFQILDRLLTGLEKRMDGFRGLDIGSGYGGWARLIAINRPEVSHIIAAEFQEKIHSLGQKFTSFAFESDPDFRSPISTWKGDVRKLLDADPKPFDFVISFLALLHIGNTYTEKVELFQKIAARLHIGARAYIEDIVALPSATHPSYQAKLKRVAWMNVQLQHTDYHKLLDQVGFAPVASSHSMVYDVTDAWKRFVLTRAQGFKALRLTTHFCLQNDGRVVPALDDQQGVQCRTLEGIFGHRQLAEDYLASQLIFCLRGVRVVLGQG